MCLLPKQITVQLSTNNGKTWYDYSVYENSVIAVELKGAAEWSDNFGNTYRRCL